MKKHLCPYIDTQGRCTHIHNGFKETGGRCPFNNALKCPMYNEWINQLKSLRIDYKGLNEDVKKGLEMYKQRWIK